MARQKAKDGWGDRVGLPWTEEQSTLLVHLRLISDNWTWIASHFPGRTVMACQSKYHYHFAPRRTHRKTDIPNVARASVSWPEHRLKTESLKRPFRTDLTGVLCGDPAPGRSALEGNNRTARRTISLPTLSCLKPDEATP
jgi:hypothetical protein